MRAITVALSLTLALLHIHAAEAQQLKKIPRVGYLSHRFPPPLSARGYGYDETFYQGLREVGYTAGKNLVMEYRYAEGKFNRFPQLAEELVRSNVDVIVATSTPAIVAAKKATRTIPIVMMTVGDPVTAEFVDSLALPGGNITGVTTVVPELGGKLLELLVEAVPAAKRVGVLWDPDTKRRSLTPTEDAARALRLPLNVLEVRNLENVEKALLATKKNPGHGLVILPAILFTMNQKRIVDLAMKNRLAAIYWHKHFAEVGGLLAYGPSLQHQLRRVGVLTGKILKGSQPTDLPVEQPTKYELVVNLMTAKQLGLTIPPNVLARANRVIK